MRFLILPSYNNLVLDQDDNLYQTRLRILISCLLDNVWIFLGEVSFESQQDLKSYNLNIYIGPDYITNLLFKTHVNHKIFFKHCQVL